jgi:hypothetical protein
VHTTVKGIGLVNLIHSAGNDGDFWPIDYRIYHPETDGKTKNDHFAEMFKRIITHKHLKAKRILFDTWYASVNNLKLIHKHDWVFFTTLKSNRLVSLSRDSGYQHLDTLVFDEKTSVTGLTIKLKEVPFMVKLFKIVAPNGDIDWVITNDLDVSVNLFVADLANDNRWQIEQGGLCRLPSGLQTTHRLREVSMPKGPFSTQPFGLLLSGLGCFKSEREAYKSNPL